MDWTCLPTAALLTTPAPNQLAASRLPAVLFPSSNPLPGIAPLLEDASTSITLFAPTDEAWAAVPPQVDLKDVETLQQASKGGWGSWLCGSCAAHSRCSLVEQCWCALDAHFFTMPSRLPCPSP